MSKALDTRGRLELLGLSLLTAVVLGGLTEKVVLAFRDERDPSAQTWLITAAVAVLIGVAAGIGIRWAWRRSGGRQTARLARRTWRTGRLPATLPLRIAVLRNLERREAMLDRGMPAWILSVIWVVVVGLNLFAGRDPVGVVTWLLVLAYFVGAGLQDVIDRRRRGRLRDLIATLREDPLGTLPPAR